MSQVLAFFVFLGALANSLADNSCPPESLQNKNHLEHHDLLFSLYVQAFEKEYCDDDKYEQRREIFHKSLEKVRQIQKSNPNIKMGVNHLMDWTDEEKNNLMGVPGKAIDNLSSADTMHYVPKGMAPDSFDWRDQNAVTEVKNQQHCGSCYIFSAIGSIEGAHAIKHKQLVSLSEQQPLDCESNGCDGGYPVDVMNNLAQKGGSEAEEMYPYKAVVGQCQEDRSKMVVKVTGGQKLTFADEESMKNALVQNGPLSIGLAVTDQLVYYNGGVADPTDCAPPAPINHAVLLVGYGTDPNGTPYWLIKNSWSTQYGEAGYVRLIRGKNACQILGLVSVATVA